MDGDFGDQGRGSGGTGAGRSRDPDLRASDAERDAVATELGEHFQAGRLSQAEFDDRLSRALAARTRRDLDELLADLPREQPAAAPPAPRRTGVPVPLVVVTLGLVAAAVAASGFAVASGHGHWAPWWIIFVILVLVRRSGWRNTRRGGR